MKLTSTKEYENTFQLIPLRITKNCHLYNEPIKPMLVIWEIERNAFIYNQSLDYKLLWVFLLL